MQRGVIYRIARAGPKRRVFLQRCFLSAAALPDPSMVDVRNAPPDFDPQSALVYRDFLTTKEGDAIVQDVSSRMKRRRYEHGHWDAVITEYKEVELVDTVPLSSTTLEVIERVRKHLAASAPVHQPVSWLPCHAIDLKKEGELNAHVDSIKFSGEVVSGISLLSPSIMRLIPENSESQPRQPKEPPKHWVDLYLPPLSLYVLSGKSRYECTHELLPSGSPFMDTNGAVITVERDRRLSIIFRDAKPE